MWWQLADGHTQIARTAARRAAHAPGRRQRGEEGHRASIAAAGVPEAAKQRLDSSWCGSEATVPNIPPASHMLGAATAFVSGSRVHHIGVVIVGKPDYAIVVGDAAQVRPGLWAELFKVLSNGLYEPGAKGTDSGLMRPTPGPGMERRRCPLVFNDYNDLYLMSMRARYRDGHRLGGDCRGGGCGQGGGRDRVRASFLAARVG